jgi:thioredoxin reductase (NADPH)
MIVREVSIENSMSRYLVDQIKATANIQVLTNAEVLEARGRERLEEVAVADQATKQVQILPAAAMFIFIGAAPRTDMVEGIVERDPAGFILTGPDLARDGARPRGWTLDRDPFLLETSCAGIFAAGDVRHGSVKRVATAVGEGAMAIALVHQYLRTV